MRYIIIKRAELEEAIYDYEGAATLADRCATGSHLNGDEEAEERFLAEASLHRDFVYRLRQLHPRSANRYRDGLVRDFKRAVERSKA